MSSLEQAIEDVTAAINAHAEGREAPFSLAFLSSVLVELKKMKASSEYVPSYPRFLLDWEASAQPLGKGLLAVAYQRDKLVKRSR
ncbi:hypothetical protein [Sphingomonas sp. IC081]|uniref:hypothetical protein n=1 Tax=Sphingomonas sp. IC081 TaxID=304378 RepID=UPI001159E033|nr:hypothetical protein [Sphingomonas sp. IC081]